VPLTAVWEKQHKEEHFEEFALNHAFCVFFTIIRNNETWLFGLVVGNLDMPMTVLGKGRH
jgi:hypothetical protein